MACDHCHSRNLPEFIRGNASQISAGTFPLSVLWFPQKAAILASWLGDKPCHQLSHLSKLPIGINYPKPEQIGADRLANAVGAHTLYGSPCIVLDFGTAVTFDVIAPANECKEVQAPANDSASAQRAGGVQAPANDSASAQRAGEVQAQRTTVRPRSGREECKLQITPPTKEALSPLALPQ